MASPPTAYNSPSSQLNTTPSLPALCLQLMAQEAGLHVDMAGFQAAMEEAKEKSRAGAKQGAAAELKFQAEETAYLQNRYVCM